MIYANYCPPPPEEMRLISAEDVPVGAENLDFHCPCCGAQVFPRGGENKRRHFFGRHEEDCTIGTSGGKYDVALVKVGFVTNVETIVTYIDPPYMPPAVTPPRGPNPDPVSGPKEAPEEEDFELRAAYHGLRNAKTIYENLWPLEESVPISLDGELTVGDLIAHREGKPVAKGEFHGQIRLFKAVRVNTSAPHPQKKGYIVLRAVDVGTKESPVFLLIRFANSEWHREFFGKVAGNENVRDQNKFIVLLGKWRKEPSWPGEAYYATVNTRCVYFTSK